MDSLKPEYVAAIAQAMIGHPRVVHQDLLRGPEDARRYADAVPRLVPFKGNEYASFIPILDWDHNLPSQALTLRVYAYYSVESAEIGWADQRARAEEIDRVNHYPEFDVPDFADLVADEAYEIGLDLAGQRDSCRLTSPWRRELEAGDAERAVEVVHRSRQFLELEEQLPDRSPRLGDAEAASWIPPCESDHDRWTLDVWYLTAYDGRFGRGCSFLVDLGAGKVVAVREFEVRAD